MQNGKLTETETQEFMTALAHLRESELANLLDLVESLVKELRRVSRHDAESPAAAAAARRLLQIWNKEVQRILKMQHANDAA